MTATEDSTQLRKIQLAATAALKEFDRICTLLGTRYVIYGGTAIGPLVIRASSRGTTTSTCACPVRTTSAFSPRRRP